MSGSLAEQFYDTLLESAHWPAERLLAHQQGQLAQLLRFARENVPFYKTRLDPVFTRSGDIDFSRWSELPLVTRQDLFESADAMRPERVPPGHGAVAEYRSSGSSGLPISVAVNGLASLVDNCVTWRRHKLHGVDWAAVNCYRPFEVDRTQGGPWGPPWDAQAQKGRTLVLDRAARPEAALRFLRDNDARYVNGGGRALHALAADAERLGIVPDLDMIFTHGEHPEDDDRAICKRVFGAGMLELYSSKEGHHMADQCVSGDGLHINAEIVLVEILNDEGSPCGVGETGQVVVTPFFNSAQPLIRYAQNDRAEVLPPCACGRTGMRIRIVGGRKPAMFSHPDGRLISRVFSTDDAYRLGARQFQVAQTGPLSFEFRYTPHNEYPADETGMAAQVRALYFADADVRIVRLDRFPPSPGDKHIEYRNEWAVRSGTVR